VIGRALRRQCCSPGPRCCSTWSSACCWRGRRSPAVRLGRPADRPARPRRLRHAVVLDRRPAGAGVRARVGWLRPRTCTQSMPTSPASGRLLDLLRHLVLPALSLGLVGAAATAACCARPCSRRARRASCSRPRHAAEPEPHPLVHSLRPALLPAITALGLSLPMVVSGSVSSSRSSPGRHGHGAMARREARDVPMVMGLTWSERRP